MNAIREVIRTPVHTIIDLGCRTGRFCRALQTAFNTDVIGVDPSEQMLTVAQRSVGSARMRVVRGSAKEILVGERAGMIFMAMSFHYFQNEMSRVTRELDRVLGDGGFVVIPNNTREIVPLLKVFDFLPAARTASIERMPSEAAVIEKMGERFQLVAKRVVTQKYADDVDDYLAKISARGLSSLKMLDDREFFSGLESLKRYLKRVNDPKDFLSEEIGLFVLRKINSTGATQARPSYRAPIIPARTHPGRTSASRTIAVERVRHRLRETRAAVSRPLDKLQITGGP